MRNRAGKIVVDLNETKQHATASIDNPVTPTRVQVVLDNEGINENETTYALFPYELNDPPIFTKSIYNSSTPISLHVDSHRPDLAGKVLFHDSEGLVKVLAGSDITLRVEAIQPNVLNVENGVPILIQKRDKLTYNWTYNGDTLLEEEGFFNVAQSILSSTEISNQISIDQNELVLRNVTDAINGTFVCIVQNDIGEISSEAIELEVVHTDKLDNKYFRQNLIKNGFAREDISDWTAIQGAIAVQPFALREAETELKKPSTLLRQHSVNEIYPHPITIGSNGIKNYDLSTLATQTSYYFTKSPYTRFSDGGRLQSVAYQDIDVTEIQDLIAGKVYGCEGVRAYFGCVMGNSVEYRAMDVLSTTNPNNPKYFYQAAPRLSFENAVLTGLPRYSGEKAYVIIQEFEGNTQLSSRRYINESEKARQVDSVILVDPLSSARDRNSPLFMEKVRRPGYLDVFKPTWEGGSPTSIWVYDHIFNPQNLPDGVGEDWLNNEAENFSPMDVADSTQLQPRLRPVFWPPQRIIYNNREVFDWVGTDPTRILNTYDKYFYSHIQDREYKRASYYSYGQYAEYQDAIITALNPRTTKIRISVVFDSWYQGDPPHGSVVPLYQDWENAQARHHWWYGDPLLNASPSELGTWPVGIGIYRSPKIYWQTILDNRHIEKMRALPITTDANYKYLIDERRNYIRAQRSPLYSYAMQVPPNIGGVDDSELQDALQRFKINLTRVNATNYEANTTLEIRNKDYAELALLASVVRKLVDDAYRRGHPSYFNYNGSIFRALLGNFTTGLNVRNAQLRNFIKNWTPTSHPDRQEKRNDTWREMDQLIAEGLGKKEPTSMITALGLVLEPITAASGDISNFRSSIMRLPTKTEDLAQRPRPVNVLQTPSDTQFRIVALETL